MKFRVLLFVLATCLGFNSSYALHGVNNPVAQLSKHDQEKLATVLQKLQGKKDITPEQVAQLLIEESDEEGIPLWALGITLPVGLTCIVGLLVGACCWMVYCNDNNDSDPFTDAGNLLFCRACVKKENQNEV